MRTRLPTLLCVDSVGLSFARGERHLRVLGGVSMEVRAGELFAVYGKRGAGKTTLLELAAGLRQPDTGTVAFGGRDLGGVSRDELAQLHRGEIAWVERDGPPIADVTIRVYVAMSLYRSVSDRVAHDRAGAMLDRIGAAEYADARWSELPDTAQALVAVAHALIREPKLLVVDDPIYGLDVIERETFTGLLRDTAEHAGMAVLLAVPELPATLHAHHIHVLANGKLIAPTPTDDHDATILPFPQTA